MMFVLYISSNRHRLTIEWSRIRNGASVGGIPYCVVSLGTVTIDILTLAFCRLGTPKGRCAISVGCTCCHVLNSVGDASEWPRGDTTAVASWKTSLQESSNGYEKPEGALTIRPGTPHENTQTRGQCPALPEPPVRASTRNHKCGTRWSLSHPRLASASVGANARSGGRPPASTSTASGCVPVARRFIRPGRHGCFQLCRLGLRASWLGALGALLLCVVERSSTLSLCKAQKHMDKPEDAIVLVLERSRIVRRSWNIMPAQNRLTV
ncbi:hypothetical protein C8Q78DRAFT_747398 [Trametes maxima]|nr:hypothetical protein C8Q78DRAFT_747398 [Trametes maxima]